MSMLQQQKRLARRLLRWQNAAVPIGDVICLLAPIMSRNTKSSALYSQELAAPE
jgi:hypothetical protein